MSQVYYGTARRNSSGLMKNFSPVSLYYRISNNNTVNTVCQGDGEFFSGPMVLFVSILHKAEKEVTKKVQFCYPSSFFLSREKKNRSVPIDKAAGLGIMNIEGRCRMAVSPDPSNRDFHVDRSGASRAVNTLLGLSTPAAAIPPSATPYSAGLSSSARFPSASPPFARERPTAFLCSSVLLHVIIAPTPYLVKFRARQGPFFYAQRNTEMCPESF